MDNPTKQQRKAIDKVTPHLMDGEAVTYVTSGMTKCRRMGQDAERNGVIAVTDRRVIVVASKMIGSDVQDFTLPSISSVDYKTGALMGTVHMSVSNDSVKMSHLPKADAAPLAHSIRTAMGGNT